MISTEWKRSLRRRAGQHGMCETKRHALEQMSTTSEAIALYLGSIEWALGENYPTLDEIRKNFNPKELEYYGIFVDKEFNGETLYGKQRYIFHNCKGTICTGLNIEQKIIPMLYFANGCDMTVRSCAHYPLPVSVGLYVFGDNRISAEMSEDIICKTYKHTVK